MSANINQKRGFTLIELLVVIAIIAVLSVMGIAVFSGVQKGARDSRRKADIDALAKAYEVQRTSSYIPLTEANFSSGARPKDPNTAKGEYFNWLPTDGSGFKVCASLEDNPAQACNTPATNCYCKVSTQGTIQSSSSTSYDPSSTQASLGLGGSSSSSCDTNGTLNAGLVGYWKMDEQPQGTTVTDLSGHGNNGSFAGSNGFLPIWQNSSSCLTGTCLAFPASGDAPQPPRYRSYVAIPTNSTSSLNLGTSDFTISGWVKAQPPATTGYTPPPTKTGVPGTGIFGKFQHDTSNFRGNFIIGFGDWSPNYLFFTHLNSSGISFSSQPYDYSPYWNQWTLITWVKSGNNLLLYLNGGAAKATFPITTPFDISFSSSGPYYIPDGNWAPGIWNNLSIDNHRIYNWALSSQDITALYNNDNGCTP